MAALGMQPDSLSEATEGLAYARGIFEHTPVAHAVFARSGRLLAANPAYRALFGREPPPEYDIFRDEVVRKLGLLDFVLRAFAGERVETPPFWYDPAQLEHVHVTGAKRAAIACTAFPLGTKRGEVSEIAVAYRDVSEQLLALERAEAREREARALSAAAEAHAALHEAIIHNIGDGVIVADTQAVLRIINPAAQQQHGVAERNVSATDWASTFRLYRMDKQPLPLEETPLYRACCGERVVDARWLVRRPDGVWRTLTGIATPLVRADGTRAGAVLLTRDETERLELEEQLKRVLHELRVDRERLVRTEGEFRAMFELAAAGIVKIDPVTRRFARVNQRFCEVLGYTAVELASLTFLEITHADDRAAEAATFRALVESDEPVQQREVRCIRKSGELVWVQVTATMLRDAQGRPETVLAIIVDVTARKRVEEQAKAISDNATVGLLLMDHRQHCVFMNPAAEQITGFLSHEVRGKPLHDYLHHTRADGTPYPIDECPIDRAFPEHRQVQGEDLFVHKDGHFYPVAFTASPLRDAAGVPSGTVIEVRDTTSEKRAQAERDRLLSELEQAVRVRDDFLSIAGHEIRTPLTALLLNLQGLTAFTARDPGPLDRGKLLTRLERAVDNGERLQRLIDELLDVSRIVSSRLSLESQELDLVILVRQVVQRFAEQAARSNVPVRVHVKQPLRGKWDRMRLEQVVSNLLTNALKYGEGHPVDIHLEREGNEAVLSVVDRGIGIAPEDHARIFERFERAVSSRNYGGLGLGLWIVRQVVEASGGSIHVESDPGCGSRFIVRLPLA